MATLDIVVVAVYFVLIFGLAQYVSRKKAGHQKTSTDYFLTHLAQLAVVGDRRIADRGKHLGRAERRNVWLGLAIASYEWMAALTLPIVGKYFLRDASYRMPQC